MSLTQMKLKASLMFFLFVILQTTAQNTHLLSLPVGVIGPETIAFDCNGNGPYTGVSDGRIFKWQGPENGWTEFAITKYKRSPLCNWLKVGSPYESKCGRPLGLKFHPKTCELYIADAYFGLMKVGQHGGVAKQLVGSANGVPLRFANDLDIDPKSGRVYFTDTSTIYSRWQWPLAIGTKDKTGRLIMYDPHNGNVSVLHSGLAFANGVALSKDGSFVLVAETTPGRIQRFWLTGPKTHTMELFAQLVGLPDNIKTNKHGDFWIAQNPISPKAIAQRKKDIGRPMKMDASGRMLQVLADSGSTSDVDEFNDRLWIGSLSNSFIVVRS